MGAVVLSTVAYSVMVVVVVARWWRGGGTVDAVMTTVVAAVWDIYIRVVLVALVEMGTSAALCKIYGW